LGGSCTPGSGTTNGGWAIANGGSRYGGYVHQGDGGNGWIVPTMATGGSGAGGQGGQWIGAQVAGGHHGTCRGRHGSLGDEGPSMGRTMCRLSGAHRGPSGCRVKWADCLPDCGLVAGHVETSASMGTSTGPVGSSLGPLCNGGMIRRVIELQTVTVACGHCALCVVRCGLCAVGGALHGAWCMVRCALRARFFVQNL